MSILKDAKRLPAIDWKLSFFGGHTQEVDEGWSVAEDKHLAFELIYVIQGSEDVIIDKTCYHLEASDMVIIPPNSLHKIQAGPKLHYFCTHFDIDDPDFVSDMINYSDIKITPQSSFFIAIKEVIQRWIQLINNPAIKEFEKKMHIQILLSQFLLILNHEIEKKKQQQFFQENSNLTIHYAKTISKKIQLELQKIWKDPQKQRCLSDISIKELIEEIGIQASYGSTLFKRVYGLSPKKYESSLILKEAKNLLKIHSLSIEEISEQLRFNSLASFSKQFKRWVNMSPQQYRNKYYKSLKENEQSKSR